MTCAKNGKSGVILCCREFLRSLDDSSMVEVKAAIASDPELANFYEVGEKFIRTRCRRVEFSFAGLRHNLESLKSRAKILLCWVDEAEAVMESAWVKLLPTVIRHPDSELWVTYNPERRDSPTNKRFFLSPPKNSVVVTVNWNNNPFFHNTALPEQMESDRQIMDAATFDWVWNGQYLERSDKQVFGDKYRVDEFEPAASWDGPYYGGDFGFANDPTAAVKVWIYGERLWIEYDCAKVKLELDDTAQYVTQRIPGFADARSWWDSARPESISYLQRHGLPSAEGVSKWPGSVEDGIQFMRSFREIVIHPRCKDTIQEFKLYSYKVDRLSDEIKSDIVDAHNHCIDAIRYALAPMIKNKTVVFGKLGYG